MVGRRACDVQLAQQVVDVLFDGVVGDDQLLGDASVEP
jgi:hypothetical protein